MPRLVGTTVSWILPLGVLIGLSSPVNARVTPLADQLAFPDLGAFSIWPVKAIESLNHTTPREPLEDGSLLGKAQLVQMRKPPTPGRPSQDPPGPDDQEDVRIGACAEKIRKAFPTSALPVSALALDQARVDQREQTVVIPLKDPREEMRAIWFDTNNITEALEVIRLLRTGKIGAVSVSLLAHRPGMLYMFHGVSKEDREACRPERIFELLGKCTECEVLEWLSLKPLNRGDLPPRKLVQGL